MPPLQPPGCRRAVTLLELLVVLVLLGLSAAVVMPALRLPVTAGPDSPLVRARTVAVRRGEAVRLEIDRDGGWTVRPATDRGGALLLSGSGTTSGSMTTPVSIVITALGTCLPESAAAPGAAPWDPVRCAVTTP